MAAYAPSLEACGVSRLTFLQFVDECNSALQGNEILSDIRAVSFGVASMSETIVMGVVTAIQALAHTSNKVPVKHKYIFLSPLLRHVHWNSLIIPE